MPAIHVHLPPTTVQPLGDVGGQRRINTSRAFSTSTSFFSQYDDDDELITYPPIIEALHAMDASMPLLNMPQYESMLVSNGIAYANGVIGILEEFFVDIIGMPIGAVQSFLAVSYQLIRRARKGKAREQSAEV
jgi:hypothetical protein